MFDITDRADVKKNQPLYWMICMEQMQHTITNPFWPISRKIGSGSPATARMETYCLLTYNGKEKKFETILKEEISGNTSQGIRGFI